MSKSTRRTISTELESILLVIDQRHSIKGAATAVGVADSTMDKWVQQLREERQSKQL